MSLRDYKKKRDSGKEYTRDLGLETLAGVLDGDISIQNHCYRADEMALVMDMAKEMGYKVSAFHHAVEAYKIGDLLAAAGIAWAFTGNNPILGEDATSSVSATFVGRNAYATYAILGLVANIALYMERSAAGLRAAGGGQELRDTLETFFGGAWIFALGALACCSAILFSQSMPPKEGSAEERVGKLEVELKRAENSSKGWIEVRK